MWVPGLAQVSYAALRCAGRVSHQGGGGGLAAPRRTDKLGPRAAPASVDRVRVVIDEASLGCPNHC